MKVKLFALGLLLFVPSVYASGFYIDGNQLHKYYQQCEAYESGEKTYDNYYACSATSYFVLGVADSAALFASQDVINSLYCDSAMVSAGQLDDIVENYLEAKPEDRHLAASALVIAALVEAYPCE